jgi:hypothetical protein
MGTSNRLASPGGRHLDEEEDDDTPNDCSGVRASRAPDCDSNNLVADPNHEVAKKFLNPKKKIPASSGCRRTSAEL